jgi:hypothetical protein
MTEKECRAQYSSCQFTAIAHFANQSVIPCGKK